MKIHLNNNYKLNLTKNCSILRAKLLPQTPVFRKRRYPSQPIYLPSFFLLFWVLCVFNQSCKKEDKALTEIAFTSAELTDTTKKEDINK